MQTETDRDLLERVKRQLYRWADQSQTGGWSTHQVDPMRTLAAEIDRHICTTEPTSPANERKDS